MRLHPSTADTQRWRYAICRFLPRFAERHDATSDQNTHHADGQ
jgi:hypothetical protein